MTFAPPALALAFVLVASVDGPQLLTVTWPNGHTEKYPAATLSACEAAIEAIPRGFFGVPDPAHARASCVPGDHFQPGWDCIAGFNCQAGER